MESPFLSECPCLYTGPQASCRTVGEGFQRSLRNICAVRETGLDLLLGGRLRGKKGEGVGRTRGIFGLVAAAGVRSKAVLHLT